MNKVLLTGRITKDPEIRYSQNGMSSLRFTLAVDRQGQRDAQGNRQADFISCVAFSQQADFMSRFVHKGNMLAIEGRIQTGQYTGQDQQVRYTTDVVVDRVENLSPRDPNQQPAQGGYQQPQQQYGQNPYQGYNNPQYGAPSSYQAPFASQPQAQPQTESKSSAPETFNVSDDDLPF